MKRQRIRRAIVFLSLLSFPIIMNLLSPYVSITAAAEGIVSGSLVVFILMFLTSIFFGRAWCGWICPISGLAEACTGVNPKPVNLRRMRISRYIIFGIWAAVCVLMFVLAGGVRGVNFLFYMESGVSVDIPVKYVIYYGVLLLFIVTNFIAGRRASCQAYCWMAPFMAGGYWFGRKTGIPQMRIVSDPGKCNSCGTCVKKCPMSIDVQTEMKKGFVRPSDCILCGECVDGCPKKVLRFGIKGKN